MTWTKLDDRFPRHPKIIALSDAAFRLHISTLCYASEHSTDGAIMTPVVRSLAGAKGMKLATELVGAGLWEPGEPDQFIIHDFLDYNPSREQLDSRRHAKSMAGAIGAASRWHVRGNAPDPTRPDPTPANQQQQQQQDRRSNARAREAPAAALSASSPLDPDSALSRASRAWDGQSPMGWNGSISDRMTAELQSGTPIEAIEEACRIAGEAGGRKPWRYVESILSRLKSGGLRAGSDLLPGVDGKPFRSALTVVPPSGDGKILDPEEML